MSEPAAGATGSASLLGTIPDRKVSAFSSIPSRTEVYNSVRALPGTPSSWGPSPMSSGARMMREGPVWRVTVSPGAVQLGTKDYSRINGSAELRRERAARDTGQPVAAAPSRGVITEWSAKSRSNLTRTLLAVDFGPLADLVDKGRLPGFTTLTYPGDWEVVAGAGETVKQHVVRFRKRYENAWGEPLVGAWKLEFQARGAPHLHIAHITPMGESRGKFHAGLGYREWCRVVWAAIVAHPDPDERAKHESAGVSVDYEATLRYADPRRIAVYFSKHSHFKDKEYQNSVPLLWRSPGAGPGRFWGIWGLDVVRGVSELAADHAYVIARHLRKLGNRSSYSRVVADVPKRTDRSTGEVTHERPRSRRVKRRIRRMPQSRGFISVNDGPAVGRDLHRLLYNHELNKQWM